MTPALLCTLALLCLPGPAPEDPPPGHLFPAGRMATLRAPDGAALLADLPAGLIGLIAPESKAVQLIADWIEAEGAEGARSLVAGPVELALYETEGSRLVQRPLERDLLLACRPYEGDAAGTAVERLAAFAGSRGAPIPSGEYRGRTYRRLGRELLVWHDDGCWIVTTSDELLADAIDRSLDPRAADDRRPPPTAVELGLAPGALRRRDFQGLRRQRRRLLPLEASPLLALVAGPFLDVLDAQEWTHGRLEHGEAGLDLTLDLPVDARPGSSPHYPAAPRPVSLPVDSQALATLVLRRDLAEWWRRRESLVGEDLQPRLARLDDAATMAFGGRSPAEDVLSLLAPELALIVAGVDPKAASDGGPVSACLVATLRDPSPGAGDVLALGFQGVIGLLNAERAESGQGAYLLGSSEHRGVLVHTARLLAAPGGEGSPQASLAPSPCLARVDDRVLLGTSQRQVRSLIDALLDGAVTSVDAELQLVIHGDAAAQALGAWRQSLAARALLEQGLSPEEALAGVDLWLSRLGALGRLELLMSREGDAPGLAVHGWLERAGGPR